MRKKLSIIKIIILIIILMILIYAINYIYKEFSFNSFLKAESNMGLSKFTRDNEVKYDNNRSFKIDSIDYNDACFYKEIKVEPNTPYRITCMIKTKDVVAENSDSNSGAQIFLVETVEHSQVIQNTEDWQQIEFMFYSKEDTNLKIGFRLGGDEDNCKGTAWFSNFKLEKGINNEDTNWHIACFIFKNIDVKINGEETKLSMSLRDREIMKENMERFKISAQELSNNLMSVTYDIYEIDEPITSITYSDEFGYYISSGDVKKLIYDDLKGKEYDYIFTVVRLGNDKENIEIPTYDWIGLGGMDLEGIGYSNIRLPNDDKNYVYTYDYKINIFPEEVYIHEFLHTLERISEEAGFERPELHENKIYGYEEKNLTGLKEWYRDYMQCAILKNDGTYIGLNPEIYKLKPVHKKDFKYSIELDFYNEPKNIIEAILNIVKK